MLAGRVHRLPTRHLDDCDSRAHGGIDIQRGGVQNVSVGCNLQRRGGTAGIAFVAPPDIGENGGFVGGLAVAADFGGAPPRPHFRLKQ